MKIKSFISLLLAFLMFCAATPASASAPAGDDYIFRNWAIEDNETLTGGSISMVIGNTRDLSGYIRSSESSEDFYYQWHLTGTILWSSSNPDVVSVSGRGIASAHRAGVARITATGDDNLGRKHVQTFIVGVSRQNSTAASNSFEIRDGSWLDMRQLAELHSGSKAIMWASSVPNVASVDSVGLVLANSIGRCIVTATYLDENNTEQIIKYSVRVTSNNLVDRTNSGTIILKAGDNLDLGLMFYPNYKNTRRALDQFYCTTGNSDVISISGLSISAKAAGNVLVFIRQRNDRADETIPFKLIVMIK